MLSDIQTDSRPWLQKPNIGEINSIYVPWILALPGLFKGNQTHTHRVWENCLLKKPRVRTLAKPYWKHVILIPYYQGSIGFPSVSIIIFLVAEGKRLFSPLLYSQMYWLLCNSSKFAILHKCSRAQLLLSVLTSGNFINHTFIHKLSYDTVVLHIHEQICNTH